MKTTLTFLLTALALTACGGGEPSSAPAQSNAAPTSASAEGTQTFAQGKGAISEERTTAFKSFMPTFSSMKKMANGDEAFEPEKFKAKAASFVKEARVPFEHFQNDPNGNGDALPAVWLKADAFKAEQDKFLNAVDALNTAAQTAKLDDIKAAFGNVGASCKACHDAFRAEK